MVKTKRPLGAWNHFTLSTVNPEKACWKWTCQFYNDVVTTDRQRVDRLKTHFKSPAIRPAEAGFKSTMATAR